MIAFLKNNGFEQAGEGAFSEVWTHTQDKMALKISSNAFDSAFVEFIDFCQRNRGNKHLPRVGKIRTYTTENNKKFFVILLERLEPFTDRHYAGNITDTIRSWMGGYSDDPVYKHSQEEQDEFWDQASRSFENIEEIKPQVIEMTSLMVKLLADSKIRDIITDLHSGNIMLRGKTVVLTDPIASMSEIP